MHIKAMIVNEIIRYRLTYRKYCVSFIQQLNILLGAMMKDLSGQSSPFYFMAELIDINTWTDRV